ncbi:dethiobiotin synthase [Shewanella sp. D64]|nr:MULTISPECIES: dethiobiotin synthase [unclassified Shewanella]MEC4725754.1 dethiobiotin synthase [Shewanella sp. D64]MEC4737639.1 dethiobiotin synthase [Shewanella sp. E94]WBJ98203.1 dethiobiotin synthase [Shewanella sp. MTB7]
MYFVTGTDTDCGKTLVSSALLCQAKHQGKKTLGLKPIASGCEETVSGLRNSDALSLISQSSIELTYSQVNPISFQPAIAPHIAAVQTGTDISAQCVLNHLTPTLSLVDEHDFCLVEGAGGWRLPLGDGGYLSQVVQQLSLPVILVVGIKLGCLNHAILTQEAILADGVKIAGWVGNIVDPDTACLEDNIASLDQMMTATCIGIIPHLNTASAEMARRYLSNITA